MLPKQPRGALLILLQLRGTVGQRSTTPDGCACLGSSNGCTNARGISASPRCGCGYFDAGNGPLCYVQGSTCSVASPSTWRAGLSWRYCSTSTSHGWVDPSLREPYPSNYGNPFNVQWLGYGDWQRFTDTCVDGVSSGLFWTDGTAHGSVPCSFCSTDPSECCDYPEAWANCPLSCGTCPPRDVCTNTCVVSVAPACTWCCYR